MVLIRRNRTNSPLNFYSTNPTLKLKSSRCLIRIFDFEKEKPNFEEKIRDDAFWEVEHWQSVHLTQNFVNSFFSI